MSFSKSSTRPIIRLLPSRSRSLISYLISLRINREQVTSEPRAHLRLLRKCIFVFIYLFSFTTVHLIKMCFVCLHSPQIYFLFVPPENSVAECIKALIRLDLTWAFSDNHCFVALSSLAGNGWRMIKGGHSMTWERYEGFNQWTASCRCR